MLLSYNIFVRNLLIWIERATLTVHLLYNTFPYQCVT